MRPFNLYPEFVKQRRESMLQEAGAFDPGEHPRDDGGQFASKGGPPPQRLKDPQTLTGGQINKELDSLDKRASAVNDKLIAAGRGSERPSDRRGKTDPLSVEYRDVEDRASALRSEINARYGPGAPHRLPPGFKPRKKAT